MRSCSPVTRLGAAVRLHREAPTQSSLNRSDSTFVAPANDSGTRTADGCRIQVRPDRIHEGFPVVDRRRHTYTDLVFDAINRPGHDP